MKRYIIDTNVFLTNYQCLNDFADENEVIIPIKVLDEIDDHKERQDSVGSNARGTIRILDELREEGSLFDGVSPKGCDGEVRISSYKEEEVPHGLDDSGSDNQIITVAKIAEQEYPNSEVIVVSRDLNLRVKCDALEIDCEDYSDIQAVRSSDSLYTGAEVKKISKKMIDKLYSNSMSDFYSEDLGLQDSHPNKFYHLKAKVGNGSLFVRYIDDNTPLKIMRRSGEEDKIWKNISPRNKEQHFSKDLLMDQDIDLVTLVGRAGTGKTLMSCAAGLHQVLDQQRYEKIVIARPVEPVGREIGFLPGSFEEKMHPWLKPIKDNLAEITGGQIGLEMYMSQGNIEIEAISYIRGRSISDAFIVIDEAQQLSLHEIKTVLTRVGDNSKIVLTGDIKQIDNPYVDETSNGLTHAVESFKHSELAGHCTLYKGERSKLASVAAEAL